MATLSDMKDRGDRITFYCRADVALCTHSWQPSWDQLIQYFGRDADFTVDRSGFQKLVCEACGGRGATIIVLPRHDPRTQGVGGHSNQGPPPDDYVALKDAEYRADLELAAVRQRDARRLHDAAKEAAKAKHKARKAIESGKNLIGPPNPWAGRKKGRWL